LIPTIRKAGSEIWLTFNPELEEDDAWQRFVVGPARADSIIRQVNWRNNPWFTDELRAEKDHLKARDPDAYENVWEGGCRSHVRNALWTKEIFGANRERAPETEGQREALLATLLRVVIGVDPSGVASPGAHGGHAGCARRPGRPERRGCGIARGICGTVCMRVRP
jgi:hypothetical protein